MVNTSITTGNYTLTNSSFTTWDGYALGNSGIIYNSRRVSNVRYTQTNRLIDYKGNSIPVYISDKGREFVFLMSRTGVEYKKYLK